MDKPNATDPQHEGARRGGIATLLVITTSVGTSLAVVMYLILRALWQGSTLMGAGRVILLASLVGVLNAMYVLSYRRAYRVLFAPRDQYAPLQNRINWWGVAVELSAAIVVLVTILTH